jgi:hypothetical protein
MSREEDDESNSEVFVRFVEGEVARSKNEFSELQRVRIIHFKVLVEKVVKLLSLNP